MKQWRKMCKDWQVVKCSLLRFGISREMRGDPVIWPSPVKCATLWFGISCEMRDDPVISRDPVKWATTLWFRATLWNARRPCDLASHVKCATLWFGISCEMRDPVIWNLLWNARPRDSASPVKYATLWFGHLPWNAPTTWFGHLPWNARPCSLAISSQWCAFYEFGQNINCLAL